MQGKQKVIVLGGILLITLAFIGWQLRPPAVQPYNRTPLIGAGQLAVDETVRSLSDHGRIVVVFPEAPGTNRQNMPLDPVWEGFRDELKKHTGISITATEFAAFQRGAPPGLASGAVKTIWERHRDADALVFFYGLPFWSEMRDFVGQRAEPKVIVVDLGAYESLVRYREYMASGVLTALICYGTGTATAYLPSPKTPREVFSQQYQVCTPQNYESLPK